jgi:NADPH-dependent curcumin reductase CurA
VGGKQLDLGVQRIAALGTVLACGAISTYERDEKIAVSGASWMQTVSSSLLESTPVVAVTNMIL